VFPARATSTILEKQKTKYFKPLDHTFVSILP
jgi:hypothetical protein